MRIIAADEDASPTTASQSAAPASESPPEIQTLEAWLFESIEQAIDGGALGWASLLGAGVLALGLLVLSNYGLRRWAGHVRHRDAERVRKAEELPPAFRGADIVLVFALWIFGEFSALLLAGMYDTYQPVADGEKAESLSATALMIYQAVSTAIRLGLVAFTAVFVWLRVVSRTQVPTLDPARAGEAANPGRLTWKAGFEHLGLDTSKFFQRFSSGAIALLIFAPAWFVLSEIWLLGLLYFDVQADLQSSVLSFAESIQKGEWLAPALMTVSAVVAAPLFEEVLFRGLLARWLHRPFGLTLAIAGSSIAFMVVHSNLQASVPLLILGAGLAYYHLRTRDLWGCVAMHALFNAINLALIVAYSR